MSMETDEEKRAMQASAHLSVATDDPTTCVQCGDVVDDEQPITRVPEGRACSPDCAIKFARDRDGPELFERGSEFDGAGLETGWSEP